MFHNLFSRVFLDDFTYKEVLQVRSCVFERMKNSVGLFLTLFLYIISSLSRKCQMVLKMS